MPQQVSILHLPASLQVFNMDTSLTNSISPKAACCRQLARRALSRATNPRAKVSTDALTDEAFASACHPSTTMPCACAQVLAAMAAQLSATGTAGVQRRLYWDIWSCPTQQQHLHGNKMLQVLLTAGSSIADHHHIQRALQRLGPVIVADDAMVIAQAPLVAELTHNGLQGQRGQVPHLHTFKTPNQSQPMYNTSTASTTPVCTCPPS